MAELKSRISDSERSPSLERFARTGPRTSLIADAADEASRSLTEPAEVVGAETIGPVGVAFVLWLRDRAREDGVVDLRFLARDGKLPFEIARALPADHWTEIDLNYLHCSRAAWSLASAAVLGVHEWVLLGTRTPMSFLLHSAHLVPFQKVIDRCGVGSADLPQPFDCLDTSVPLGPTMVVQWKQLLDSGQLDAAIGTIAEQRRHDIARFLSTSRFGSGPIGLVDVGWSGQQAVMAQALIEDAVGIRPIHYHIGGHGVSEVFDDRATIRRFAFDDSRLPQPIDSPVAALEMLLGSASPRLVGYEADAAGVREVFADEPGAASTPSVLGLRRGAISVASRMPASADVGPLAADDTDEGLHRGSRRLLSDLWNDPTDQELEVFSDFLFEVDESGSAVGPVLKPYSLSELTVRNGAPRQWREGSLRMTPAPFRHVMRGYFAVRSARST